jgi:transposase
MAKVQKTSTREFTEEAVRLAQTSGTSLTQVVRDLGISDTSIHQWRKELAQHGQEAFPGSGHQTPLEEENRRLKRERERVQQERDILQKEVRIFSREVRWRCAPEMGMKMGENRGGEACEIRCGNGAMSPNGKLINGACPAEMNVATATSRERA